jgi:hypothetical protein
MMLVVVSFMVKSRAALQLENVALSAWDFGKAE